MANHQKFPIFTAIIMLLLNIIAIYFLYEDYIHLFINFAYNLVDFNIIYTFLDPIKDFFNSLYVFLKSLLINYSILLKNFLINIWIDLINDLAQVYIIFVNFLINTFTPYIKFITHYIGIINMYTITYLDTYLLLIYNSSITELQKEVLSLLERYEVFMNPNDESNLELAGDFGYNYNPDVNFSPNPNFTPNPDPNNDLQSASAFFNQNNTDSSYNSQYNTNYYNNEGFNIHYNNNSYNDTFTSNYPNANPNLYSNNLNYSNTYNDYNASFTQSNINYPQYNNNVYYNGYVYSQNNTNLEESMFSQNSALNANQTFVDNNPYYYQQNNTLHGDNTNTSNNPLLLPFSRRNSPTRINSSHNISSSSYRPTSPSQVFNYNNSYYNIESDNINRENSSSGIANSIFESTNNTFTSVNNNNINNMHGNTSVNINDLSTFTQNSSNIDVNDPYTTSSTNNMSDVHTNTYYSRDNTNLQPYSAYNSRGEMLTYSEYPQGFKHQQGTNHYNKYWEERREAAKDYASNYLEEGEQNRLKGITPKVGIDRLFHETNQVNARKVMSDASDNELNELGEWIEQEATNRLLQGKFFAKDIGLYPTSLEVSQRTKDLFGSYVKNHRDYFGSNNYGRVDLTEKFINDLKDYTRR